MTAHNPPTAGERRHAPQDGGRGSEYRWRGWFLRIFGADCGYVFTPAVRGRKVYARWAFGTEDSHGWGLLAYRDDDDEPALDVSFGRLANLTANVSDYGGQS